MAQLYAVSPEGHSLRSHPHRTAVAKPARILIADDETSVRVFIDQILRGAGYVTARAFDGQDALDMAEQLCPFDLLVTDELMPRMLGHELARELRRREPKLRVLYLTGYSDRLFEQKAILWKCDTLLYKPVTPERLLEAVSLLLSDHASALTPRACRGAKPRLVR